MTPSDIKNFPSPRDSFVDFFLRLYLASPRFEAVCPFPFFRTPALPPIRLEGLRDSNLGLFSPCSKTSSLSCSGFFSFFLVVNHFFAFRIQFPWPLIPFIYPCFLTSCFLVCFPCLQLTVPPFCLVRHLFSPMSLRSPLRNQCQQFFFFFFFFEGCPLGIPQAPLLD